MEKCQQSLTLHDLCYDRQVSITQFKQILSFIQLDNWEGILYMTKVRTYSVPCIYLHLQQDLGRLASF